MPAPSSARRRAMPAPMPREPPTTSAILSFRGCSAFVMGKAQFWNEWSKCADTQDPVSWLSAVLDSYVHNETCRNNSVSIHPKRLLCLQAVDGDRGDRLQCFARSTCSRGDPQAGQCRLKISGCGCWIERGPKLFFGLRLRHQLFKDRLHRACRRIVNGANIGIGRPELADRRHSETRERALLGMLQGNRHQHVFDRLDRGVGLSKDLEI